MTDLDLLSTDVEDDVRATVRGLLADRCDPVAVTAVYDGDRSAVAPLWKSLAADSAWPACSCRRRAEAPEPPRGRRPWCWRSWAAVSRRCRS